MKKETDTAHSSDTLLQTEQVRLLSASIFSGAPSLILVAALMAWVLWDNLPHSGLAIWFGMLTLTQLLRLALLRVIRRKPYLLTLKHWLTLLRIGALLGGLAWGALPIMLFPSDTTLQLLIVLFIIGVISGVQIGLVADRISVMLFSVSILAPLSARFLSEGDATPTAIGILGLLYLVFLFASTRNNEHSFRESILLRENAEHLNNALNQAQQVARLGSFDWNIVTGELQWTDEHFRLWGLTPDSVIPDYPLFLRGIHADDVTRHQISLQEALQGGHDYDCVHRVVWPDGHQYYMHGRGEVIFDDTGHAVRMIGTVQDISEQVKTEKILTAARDEANRANASKSEFLSRMSHELRTPMNAILGFSQLMKYDTTLSEDNLDYVREIITAGDHLLFLINEILDLSRVESGTLQLMMEPVEVCAIVDECLSLISTLADKRNISISHHCIAGLAVHADRIRLKQCLLNLLSNAIKYNREGGSVTLGIERADTEHLRIMVSDTGIGIPANRMSELFKPFSRLDAEKSAIEGSGIGLTITRSIVELMGGSVEVKSEAGVGSTFYIELPLVSTTVAGNTAITTTPNRIMALNQVEDAKHTVLYIEDNPSNIKLLERILSRRQNIQLLTAHTSELGIELAQTHPPELILLDINLPGMDGYQVMKVFKADAELQGIPVIAVTANAMPQDIARGMAAGFDDYLTKLIDIMRLNKLIDTHLR